jgi:Holliday junction resolvasome RuvABC endonuclease subunit
MIILALDVATVTGWAVHDTGRHVSSIQCGVIDLSCKADGPKKRRIMRRALDEALCRLIDRFRPEAACVEQPLNFIGSHEKKPKGAARRQLGLFVQAQPTAASGSKKGGGPNADTTLMLNQLFAVADTVCSHKCRLVMEVAPTTWQRLTSAYPGDTKARSVAFCRSARIVFPAGLNQKETGDAADAAVIAFWAAGHAQELKLIERARAA